jgi:hypothetical protein
MGIPPEDLDDDVLRREIDQLRFKESDIFTHGTPDQRANHILRTQELEAEFLRRFGVTPT